MSKTSSDRCIDGDDSTNINRDDFYIPSFRDYRDFYRAGLHRERTPVHSALQSYHLLIQIFYTSFTGVDILPNPNAFTVENTSEWSNSILVHYFDLVSSHRVFPIRTSSKSD
jgi:hypothetical protein